MRLLVFVLFSFVWIASAFAQPATVDGELALALLGLDGADALMVDTVPTELSAFMPEGTVAIGSLRRTDAFYEGGETVIALGWIEDEPEAAALAHEARSFPDVTLRDEGRRLPVEHGFVSEKDSPQVEFSYSPKTREGRATQVSFRPRAWGGTLVRVVQRPIHADERLPGEPSIHPSMSEGPQASLPKLTPPPGSEQHYRGGGGGGDSFTSEATVDSAMPLDALAAHYGQQLAEAGWVPGGGAATDEVATSVWTRIWEGNALAAMFYAHRDDPASTTLRVHVTGPDR